MVIMMMMTTTTTLNELVVPVELHFLLKLSLLL